MQIKQEHKPAGTGQSRCARASILRACSCWWGKAQVKSSTGQIETFQRDGLDSGGSRSGMSHSHNTDALVKCCGFSMLGYKLDKWKDEGQWKSMNHVDDNMHHITSTLTLPAICLITEYQSRMHVNSDSKMCCVCKYWVTDDSGSSGSTKGAVIENNMYWEDSEWMKRFSMPEATRAVGVCHTGFLTGIFTDPIRSTILLWLRITWQA